MKEIEEISLKNIIIDREDKGIFRLDIGFFGCTRAVEATYSNSKIAYGYLMDGMDSEYVNFYRAGLIIKTDSLFFIEHDLINVCKWIKMINHHVRRYNQTTDEKMDIIQTTIKSIVKKHDLELKEIKVI